MKILVTAPGRFTGDKLEAGRYYYAEPADAGTDAQNRCFHGLLQEYWRSGCHSYKARSFPRFRALIKLYLGAGAEKYYSLVNEDGSLCPQGKLLYRLKSWRDYTKKERMRTIDALVSEMVQAGADTEKFREILAGMEGGEHGSKDSG